MKHNWEYQRLGDICQMKSGNFISADELNEAFEYPCFGGNGIRGYIQKYSNDGDFIIIGRVGALCGNVNQFNGKFYATEHAIVATPKTQYLSRWLYYTLLKLNLRKYAKGAAQPVISVGTLNKIDVPVPPKEVQEQIVAELDAINGLIDKNREVLRNLDALAQSLFYDTFSDPITNPKGFQIAKLVDVFSIITDGTHQTPTYTEDKVNGIKFLSAKNVVNGYIDWNNIKYIPFELHQELHKRLAPQRGDILLCKNGTTGICALVETDETFDIYVSLALLRPKTDYIGKYLVYAINNPFTKEQFNHSLKGIGVPNLHLNKIRETKIIVPPLALQEAFAEKIEAIEEQKAKVEAATARLQTLLDSRMDYWFN